VSDRRRRDGDIPIRVRPVCGFWDWPDLYGRPLCDARCLRYGQPLDIDVDHVAGRFFFVADDGFRLQADSSDRPLALPIRAAVARDRPTFAAIFQKGMRLRRIASTASSCSLPVFFLSRRGLLVRSCSPAVPSALCRRTHLQTVAVETPRAVAMAPDVSPAALRLTICSRPRGSV
jgi:hypothetical protein